MFLKQWRSIVVLLLVFGLSIILLDTTSAATQATFYISPSGNDNNAGSQANPWQTLEKARDHISTINSNMSGDIIVYLRDGTYDRNSTFTLDAQDSGTNGYSIIYQAYPGETPVLNGATQVTGWTQHDGNIYSATLNQSSKLRTLIVNDERAYMASRSITGQGGWGTYTITAGQADWARISGSEDDGVQYNLSDLPSIQNADDVEIMRNTTWNSNIVTVREAAVEGGYQVLKLSQPSAAIAMNQDWSAFAATGNHTLWNAYEFLDSPGEFYFNKSTNTLYYYTDGENMSTAVVYAPQLSVFIDMAGTSTSNRITNVTFKGITFANSEAELPEVDGSPGKSTVQAATWKMAYSDSNWHNDKYQGYDVLLGAINVNNAQFISFEDNIIKHIGNEGIAFTNDVSDSQIIGNAFIDIGGSGINVAHPQHVYIGDGGSGTDEKYGSSVEGVVKDVLIENNLLYDTTRLYYGHAAITGFFTDGLTIEHNQIQNTRYSGVSLGWGWWDFDEINQPGNPTTTAQNNKFNYNRVYNVMTMLHDGGAFYTLGSQPNSEANGNYVKAPTEHFQGVYHPDEGTAWYTGSDLVFEILPGQDNFELNDWRRKHDNHYDNIYSTSSAYQIGAPDSTITNLHVYPDANWPTEAQNIIAAAGLESAYQHLLVGIPDPPEVPGLSSGFGIGTAEAEDAALLGNASTYADSAASGGYGVEYLNNVGDGLEFTAVSESTLTTISYASKQSGTISFYVDDVHVKNISFTSNGAWNGSYVSLTEDITIPAGSVAKFQSDSGDSGINIDYFVLEDASGGFYEAENAILTGAAVGNSHTGYSGTGYAETILDVGDAVEFTVYASNAGQYALTTRYAAGDFYGTDDRSMSLYINGIDVVQAVFPNTLAWDSWSDQTESITLAAGANTVRYQYDNDDTGVVNLDYIQLSVEGVEGSVNIALNQPASQSSTAYSGVPERAVDGNTSGVWSEGSVTHTSNEAQPWWEVDLGSSQGISDIVLFNRTNCCTDRLSDFYVYVSDSSFGTRTDVAQMANEASWSTYHSGALSGASLDIAANANGRYVRIQLSGTNPLSLAEVQVMSGSGTTPPTSTSYEAEDATLTSVVVGSSHAGYSGTGFVENILNVGDAVAFTVNVSTAGQYSVDLRYAMGSHGPSGDRSMSVYVNGTDVVQTSFTTTGAWDSWSNQAETVTLQAGNNTVKYQLDADDTGWINIDYITVSGAN